MALSGSPPAAITEELAHQSPEAISAMFGRIANRYDLLNHVLCGGTDLYWRWHLARAVRDQRPARVLDLATGSGDVLLSLARHKAYTGLAAGADFCLPMLQRARAKSASNLLAGDALHLPFPAGKFDAVTISFGLRNLADRSKGLQEIRRMLRQGGRAYILEFSHPAAWFAPLYFWYLRAIMPWYARLFTREKGAYQYLADSIQKFPRQSKLAGMLTAAGFRTVRWRNLTLGIVALHVAEV